jgi:hypothetical protein
MNKLGDSLRYGGDPNLAICTLSHIYRRSNFDENVGDATYGGLWHGLRSPLQKQILKTTSVMREIKNAK